MTTTAAGSGSEATTAPARPSDRLVWREAFTGTAALLRLDLRRDRVKLPAWVLGITLMAVYYAAALPQVYRTPEDLRVVSRFGAGVVGALLCGPGYGLTDPTIESVIVGIYGLYFLLVAALMNILLLARHTRVEEQSGRAELVRANVVGRHAQLTAALLVALIANAVLAALLTATFAVTGLRTDDAALFAVGVAAAGMAFAAVTAITVQVTAYSRVATGMAGAVVGVAYAVRAAGDAIDEGGSWLSWTSPLAWSQQTRAYADGRWWPLLLSMAFVAVATGVAYTLSTRRDLGAGLLPPRPGRRHAPAWLSTPLALATRLHRAGVIGWGCALTAVGALYGSIGSTVVTAFEDLPDQLVEVMGGDANRMLDGYLGIMAFFDALLVTSFAVLAVQTLRGEETRGRTESVLATATGRIGWFSAYLGVTAVGALALLTVSGLVFGIALAVSVGDGGHFVDILVAHVAFFPAVLLVLAVAALLYGFAPQFIGATWALFGFSFILGFFGPIMDLPRWVHDLSPFEHVARLPLQDLRWMPLVVLTVLAAAAATAGAYGFRHRDLDTK
ncbi:ABC transporter permease [Nocardia sp. CNY236]|uniref:ABC transporter permease n=1 Tax=Nocardia sp. CNY236 TaxID=1169152 RepID=UPI000417F69E|nr:ABC transporter permease [Nocardia sp. CNY236]